MAVAKRWIVASVSVALSMAVGITYAGDYRVSVQVQHDVQRRIAKRMATYGEKARACQDQAAASPQPRIDEQRLQKVGVTRLQVMQSLLYLQQENLARCTNYARARLAFMIAQASQLKDLSDEEKSAYDQARQELLMPGLDELRAGAVFHALPADTRSYLQNVVGTAPFDAMAIIQEGQKKGGGGK